MPPQKLHASLAEKRAFKHLHTNKVPPSSSIYETSIRQQYDQPTSERKQKCRGASGDDRVIKMIKTGLRASPTDHISRYETNAISSNGVMNRFSPAINKLYYRLASLKSKPAQKTQFTGSRGFTRGLSRRFKDYCKQNSHDLMQEARIRIRVARCSSSLAPVLNSKHAHDIGILATSFHSSFAAIMLASPPLLVPPDFRNGSKAMLVFPAL